MKLHEKFLLHDAIEFGLDNTKYLQVLLEDKIHKLGYEKYNLYTEKLSKDIKLLENALGYLKNVKNEDIKKLWL